MKRKTKAERRESKKKKKMRVSGKSVFQLQGLILKKGKRH